MRKIAIFTTYQWIILFSIFLIMIKGLLGCGGGDSNPKPPVVVVTPVKQIDSVFIYFENSLSMSGYLKGTNFRQVIHRLFSNIDQTKLGTYFVNDSVHFTDDMLSRIDNNDIFEGFGNVNTSDHEFIFKNAIDKVGKNSNSLGIVITDGIYSVQGGSVAIVAINIEKAFRDALKSNELETVVLKLNSDFNGMYYKENCASGGNNEKIHQSRPYYIMLFGDNDMINLALEKIVNHEELPGYDDKEAQQARFLLTKNSIVNYSIIPIGEEVVGKIRPVERRDEFYRKITAEQGRSRESSQDGGSNTIQFGIAIDYTNTNIPITYLENINNYSFSNTVGYSIEEIKNLNSLSHSTKTFKYLQSHFPDQSFTHLIVIGAKENMYGKVDFSLENNLPKWIEKTGVESDCRIVTDTSTTIAFDYLMIGINKAYQKINKNKNYYDFKIEVKP